MIINFTYLLRLKEAYMSGLPFSPLRTGIKPNLTRTDRALVRSEKKAAGVAKTSYSKEDIDALVKGLPNLETPTALLNKTGKIQVYKGKHETGVEQDYTDTIEAIFRELKTTSGVNKAELSKLEFEAKTADTNMGADTLNTFLDDTPIGFPRGIPNWVRQEKPKESAGSGGGADQAGKSSNAFELMLHFQ